MLSEIKLSTNMILRNFSLKHVIMMTGLKLKNSLIQQGKEIMKNRVIKQKSMKNLLIYHQFDH